MLHVFELLVFYLHTCVKCVILPGPVVKICNIRDITQIKHKKTFLLVPYCVKRFPDDVRIFKEVPLISKITYVCPDMFLLLSREPLI